MKKILIAVLCGAMALTVVGCSTKGNDSVAEQSVDVALSDIMEEILEAGMIAMPVEADDTTAVDIFGLNLDDVEEYAIVDRGISVGQQLVMLVEAKEGKVEQVTSVVKAYLANRTRDAFYPAEKELLETSEVRVSGNVVYLTAFSEEEQQAQFDEIISKYLK